ncbi:MAG TPA: hypothetical protein VF132_14275 [Rudaea sp.]
MEREQDLLQQTLRMARAGRKFFAAVTPSINDAEVRGAFEYICEVKARLVGDLERLVSAPADDTAEEHVSAAVSLEKTYATLEKTFRNEPPAASARLLALGEEQLLRAVERSFEAARHATLKELLKTYYPQLVICREAMARLRSRQAA